MLSTAITHPTCPPDAQNPGLGNDGAITLSVSGGTPDYGFNWSGPDGFNSTDQNISGLIAGTYSVTVTDANGCTATTSVTLNYLNPNPVPPTSIDH